MLAHEGAKFAILFAGVDAQSFLDDLTDRERATIMHAMDIVANTGRHSNDQRFKLEKGFSPPIVVFKNHQIRVFGVMDGRYGTKGRIVLTHGMKKKTDRTPPVEFTRCHRIYKGFTGE
jgi:hypothetical protein